MRRLISQIRPGDAVEAYYDDINTSQSSLKNLQQPIRFQGNQINLHNVVSAIREPSNFSVGASKSANNYSVGPNDDSLSQASCDRQRRAQYHRLLSLGKMDEVEKQVSQELQSNNEDAITLYTRAKLAEKQKRYADAIVDFGKVLQIDPTFYNAAYAKASCENIIGRFDDAIETYNLAFTKDLDVPVVLTQSNCSRITSKIGSPKNIRMSRQGSKLFYQGSSPYRMNLVESLEFSANQAEDDSQQQSIG